MDSDGDPPRTPRLSRLLFGLVAVFVTLLTVGTSLIFAGYPGIGITLVVLSPIALVVAGVVLLRG